MEHKIHSCIYCIYWNIVCKVGIEGPAISHLVYCLILLLPCHLISTYVHCACFMQPL